MFTSKRKWTFFFYLSSIKFLSRNRLGMFLRILKESLIMSRVHASTGHKVLYLDLFSVWNKRDYCVKTIGLDWFDFNVRLQECNGLLPTVWDSSLMRIRRHAITILICHREDMVWYPQRDNLNANLQDFSPTMYFTCNRCHLQCFARRALNLDPPVGVNCSADTPSFFWGVIKI